jgi:hypothetical protein
MAWKLLSGGIGSETGDSLVIAQQLFQSGQTWYVSSVSGSDSASPRGLDRAAALATLGQAVTNSSSGDIIVLMSDHDETLTSTLSINKRLCIVGEGESAGVPTPKLRMNHASNNLLSIASDGVQIRGIKFPTSTQTNSGYRITVTDFNSIKISGCYFECGANDAVAGNAIFVPAGDVIGLTVSNTTFISTSTTTKPGAAVYIAGSVNYTEWTGVVFSNGTIGFYSASSGYYAFYDQSTITDLHMEGISLLLGADIRIASATTGWTNVETVTGNGQVAIE